VDLLNDFYMRCKSKGSRSLNTWCTGLDETFYSHDDENDDDDHHQRKMDDSVCPKGVKTHPCSGLILDLHGNGTSVAAAEMENDSNLTLKYLAPWQGIRCNTSTSPPSISHM
jgi:uncharacterized UPF0160 family protein